MKRVWILLFAAATVGSLSNPITALIAGLVLSVVLWVKWQRYNSRTLLRDMAKVAQQPYTVKDTEGRTWYRDTYGLYSTKEFNTPGEYYYGQLVGYEPDYYTCEYCKVATEEIGSCVSCGAGVS